MQLADIIFRYCLYFYQEKNLGAFFEDRESDTKGAMFNRLILKQLLIFNGFNGLISKQLLTDVKI